jgi:aconitate hydratase
MDNFGAKRSLSAGGERFDYLSLEAAEAKGLVLASRLPLCLRVMLENVLRSRDGSAAARDLAGLSAWLEQRSSDQEMGFYPARILMPDSSGVPLIADLAALRDAVSQRGGDPARVSPLIPVDLVIDHSIVADAAGRKDAHDINLRLEYERNRERYSMLKWAQTSFANLRVIPPGMGIVHQVNVEYLARVVWVEQRDGQRIAYPDTLVGMDSHTPMVNSLGVIGWGVGGIEAAAAMLGQPISMLIPEVVGCRVSGRIRPGVTSTDVVLSLTQQLRQVGVVGKFVEFFGDGLDHLPLAHRATLANMTPEMGATVSFFPIDDETIRYLSMTGRSREQVALVEAYAKEQGLWRTADTSGIAFTDVVDFHLEFVEPSVAGPRRPQDRVNLHQVPDRFRESYAERHPDGLEQSVEPGRVEVRHGDVVIAAITSCTNTSNPQAMIGAGLMARNLRTRGLQAKPWVKTSLSPGSRVVTEYLKAAGLQAYLDALGFHLVGYGCMTCAGGSGPLSDDVTAAIETQDLTVAAVLSGNRNFEGRIHPSARANFLASPALVVAYAAAGSVLVDIANESLGTGSDGRAVYLKDVWPSDAEIQQVIDAAVTPRLFSATYAGAHHGSSLWQKLPASSGTTFAWNAKSTFIKRPPFLDLDEGRPGDIAGARALLMLGDSITTDHISPVAGITPNTPAGDYLAANGVLPADFNSLLSRRANHEVMIRGTFANKRLRNELVGGCEGGFTRRVPGGAIEPVFDVAMEYARDKVPLVVVAGAEYGTGSSRDWAAKGTRLLGVKAVLAESFERIHRSNLAAMGVLPLQFPSGVTRKTLGLSGNETFTITGLNGRLTPRMPLPCTIAHQDGSVKTIDLICRLDVPREVEWYREGGVLPYVLERLIRPERSPPMK